MHIWVSRTVLLLIPVIRNRNLLAEDGRQCSYFTMMRHPVDRLISAFFYCPQDHDVQGRPVKV